MDFESLSEEETIALIEAPVNTASIPENSGLGTDSKSKVMTDINGYWNINIRRGRPNRTIVSNFSGSIIFANRSWFMVGTADYHNTTFGQRGTGAFASQYDQNSDTFSASFGAIMEISEANPLRPDSPVLIVSDVNNKKVDWVLKRFVSIPQNSNYGLYENSFLSGQAG